MHNRIFLHELYSNISVKLNWLSPLSHVADKYNMCVNDNWCSASKRHRYVRHDLVPRMLIKSCEFVKIDAWNNTLMVSFHDSIIIIETWKGKWFPHAPQVNETGNHHFWSTVDDKQIHRNRLLLKLEEEAKFDSKIIYTIQFAILLLFFAHQLKTIGKVSGFLIHLQQISKKSTSKMERMSRSRWVWFHRVVIMLRYDELQIQGPWKFLNND